MNVRKITLLLLVLITLSTGLWTAFAKPKKVGTKITDQLGRKVQLPAKVERIVSLWPEATRVLFSLGAANMIVGLDSYSKTCPILTRIFPQIENIVNVGNPFAATLSMEKLALLKPDIVFVRTDNPDLANSIQRSLGVPAIAVGICPPGKKISWDIITIIGKCIRKEKRAKELKDYLEGKLFKITSTTAKIPDKDKPRVYQAFGRDLLKTLGYSPAIDLAGGKNVAEGVKEVWYSVSLEDVLRWDPQIIILHGFGEFDPDDVLNNPQWQPIAAVKKRKVYKLTLGWVGRDPGGLVINVMANAKIFHPTKFKFNLENEANEIFNKLYGIEGLYTKLKNDYRLFDINGG